jgi:hypothetical protein
VGKEGHDVGQVAADQADGVDHGRQAGMGRPEVPPFPVMLGPAKPAISTSCVTGMRRRPQGPSHAYDLSRVSYKALPTNAATYRSP